MNRLTDENLKGLDEAVARGAFPSLAAAVRAGLLAQEREAQIAAAYRHGYAAEPAEPAVGETGLRLGAAWLAEHELSALDDALRIALGLD